MNNTIFVYRSMILHRDRTGIIPDRAWNAKIIRNPFIYSRFAQFLSQYLVFLPSLGKQSRTLGPNLSTRLVRYSQLRASHSSVTRFTSCSLFFGRGSSNTESWRTAPTCSITFKSGEFPGQSVQTLTFSCSSTFTVTFAKWAFAPSCIRTQCWGLGNCAAFFSAFTYVGRMFLR